MAHGTVSLDKVIDKADHTGVLNLAGRNLRQFPMSAQDLSDLQDTLEADISMNRFDKVPREICMFSGLETLNCHHNSIRTVPDYITYMGSLQKLDLSRNFITSLPPEICRLNLVSLNLSHNRLVCIPIDIGSMTSLKRLDLSCNLLPDLPPGLCSLRKLKYLNLHNNELKELPQDIDKLPLDFLDVSTNLIKTIPTSLRHVKSLITFDISDNPLESPPAHVCVRGRVHIFKYLQSLDQRGPDPVVYHPTPADIKKRGRGVRKSRPVSGVSCVSVESSTSSFADEMHRFVDTAFGNFTTSHKELHKSDTDLTLHDGHSRSHISSSSLSSASPGRRRVNNAYATLPRNGPETKTIVEEPPLPEPVVVKQSSVPAEDNKKVNQGRSLPGEQKPRSGSWNSQKKTEEVRDHSRESRDHKVPTPVISSKTPDFERKPSPSTSNYAMRNAKSSSDVSIINQGSTKEITKETQLKVPSHPAEQGSPQPSLRGRETSPPMKSSSSDARINIDSDKGPQADRKPEDIVELQQSPVLARKFVRNTPEPAKEVPIPKSPEATRKSPEPAKKSPIESVEKSPQPVEKSPEPTRKSPEPSKKSPESTKKSPDPTKKVTTQKSPESTKKTNIHKSPEATKKASVQNSPAGSRQSTPVHSKRTSDLRNSPGPARKPADKSPSAAKKSTDVKKSPVAAKKTSGISGEAPKKSNVGDKKTDSPKRTADKKSLENTTPGSPRVRKAPASSDANHSPKGSPVASKKPIRAASKSPVSTRNTTVAPNKSPVATRKATSSGTSVDSPAKKSTQKVPSSSSASKSKDPLTSPTEKKTKRKSIQDLQLIFQEMSGTNGGDSEEQKTPTAVDQPMMLGVFDTKNSGSVNGEETIGIEQVEVSMGGDQGGIGNVDDVTPTPTPIATPIEKSKEKDGDDDTLTRRKGVKAKKKRNPSTSSTGSTRSRTSSTEDGEELKELMRRRSLPRQPMNFTVRRQEMNMMHGYKKMAAVQKRMEELLGVTVNDDFLSSLEDGSNLCLLVNKLHPGTIAHVYSTSDGQPLSVPKKAKNVDAFVKACRQLGIETAITTGDVLSIKDPMKVIKCIEELLESV